MNKFLYDSSDWTTERIERTYDAIAEIAAGELGLDTYPDQLEIVSSDQMIAAKGSMGLPIMYHHWSFGKKYIQQRKRYQQGLSGLPYEMVINSDPCVSYLMEENSMTMQTLVIAHACFGHNAFFKGNRLFRFWTDAEAIVDYLRFAKGYVNECIQKHGPTEVEQVLDACHALGWHGINKHKKPAPLSAERKEEIRKERLERDREHRSYLWEELMDSEETTSEESFPEHPEENLLYFIEKNAPNLDTWKREIIRIVRKIKQYTYPQAQTKLMNEGFATFTHYYIMNRLREKGQIPEWSHLEFLRNHTNVMTQPDWNSPNFRQLNPYTIGFAIFQDIRRICEAPTAADRQRFPNLADSDWREAVMTAMKSFRDESFIQQYLSPKVVKDLKLFAVENDTDKDYVEVSAIQQASDFAEIRDALAQMFDFAAKVPSIEVVNVDTYGDRTLTLQYDSQQGKQLEPDDKKRTLEYIEYLWEYSVELD